MSSFQRGAYTPPLLREPGFGRIDPLGVEPRDSGTLDPRRGGMLLMVSIAVLLALMGVIWSTYNQGVREGGRDGPPRIAALAAPFKVVPADPGGETTEHLGATVFDIVEDRLAAAEVETHGPEPLGVEEAALDAAANGVEAIADWEVVEPHDIHSGSDADDVFADLVEPAGAEALVEPDGGQGGLSLAEAPPPADGFAQADLPGEGAGYPIPRLKPLQRDLAEETGPLDGPRTLADVSDAASRPYFARREVVMPSRPAGDAAPPAAAAPSPGAVAAVPQQALSTDARVAAAPTPAAMTAAATGSFLVQVASFRSPDAAQQGWVDFHDEFGDLLDGFAPDVAEADLGDRGTYYRLRVGVFTNRAAASAFCDQVKARDRECLVVGS